MNGTDESDPLDRIPRLSNEASITTSPPLRGTMAPNVGSNKGAERGGSKSEGGRGFAFTGPVVEAVVDQW